MPAAALERTPARTAARVALAVLGGYATSAALAAVAAGALAGSGMARADAVTLTSMLGYLVFLVLGLWAFAARRLRTVAWPLGVGTFAWAALLVSGSPS